MSDGTAQPPTPPPLPVLELNYATRTTDGLPDFILAAEDLIEDRHGPESFGMFDSPRLATRYFAKSMERRFPDDSTSNTCCACSKPGTRRHTLRWAADVKPSSFEIALSSTVNQTLFTTHHVICDRCESHWKRKNRLWMLVRIIAVVMRWSFAIWIAVQFTHLRGSAPPDLTTFFILLGLVAAGYLLQNMAKRGRTRALPIAVAWISRKSVTLRTDVGIGIVEYVRNRPT